MIRKTLVCSLYCLCTLLLAGSTLLAQVQMVHGIPHSPNVTPLEAPAPQLVVLFSNLGPSTNAYDDTQGYFVSGPNTVIGIQWEAVPFVPKRNATVTQLQVAVGYYFSGPRQMIVGLYSDASDSVGAPLATVTTTRIPDFGACCKLVTVNITPTAVTAGTQYWLAATSDDVNAPDFEGIWAPSTATKTAYNQGGSGWSTSSNIWPAAAVRGTVP